MKKRFLSLGLVLILTVTLIPVSAYQVCAEENGSLGMMLNPLYEEILDAEEEAKQLAEISNEMLWFRGGSPVFETEKEAADYLKRQMIQRADSVVFLIDAKKYHSEFWKDIFSLAVAFSESGGSTEGDGTLR